MRKTAIIFGLLIAVLFANMAFADSLHFTSETVFNPGETDFASVSSLNQTHFVVAYQDHTNDWHGTARVGHFNGSSIIWDTDESVFNPENVQYSTQDISVSSLNSTHFVVTYRDAYDANNDGYGTARVGHFNGSSIIWDTDESVFNLGNTIFTSVSSLNSTHFVVAYRDYSNSSYGTARIGHFTGSSISWDTPETVFNVGYTDLTSVSSLDSTHFVIAYRDDSNSSYGTARIGHFTGSSISWDTPETVFNVGSTDLTSVSSLNSTHFVVTYRDASHSSYGTARIGHFTGSSISWDTPETVFNPGVTWSISTASLDSTHFVIVYQDYTSYGTARIGHFTGSSISWDTPETVFNPGTTNYISVSSLTSTHFVVAYRDDSNSKYGTARIGHFFHISLSLTPNPIYTNNNATCSAEFSMTADNATLKWYVNGAEIASAEQNCTDCSSISGTLTSDNFVKGDTIKCEVSTTKYSNIDTADASEVVSNSPPVVQSQTINGGYNSTFVGGVYSNITLECNATDADNDTITKYAFYIADSEGNENLVYNGSENSYTMNVSNYTTGNYTFICKVYDNQMTDWLYRKPITITETSGSTLTDYQVKLTIDTASLISAGKMNSDCSDIRFVDSDDTTELSYWIEDGTCDSSSTIVWVKIPSLTASSSKTIYMYYGNPSATSKSNIDNTFIFGDNFEGTSLDTTKWQTDRQDGTIEVNGGNLHFQTSSGYDRISTKSFTLTMGSDVVELKVKGSNNPGHYFGMESRYTWYGDSKGFAVGSFYSSDGVKVGWRTRNGHANTGTDLIDWRIVKVALKSSSTFDLSDSGGGSLTDVSTNGEDASFSLKIDDYKNDESGESWWDWVFVRKYASSEPTSSIGTEESTGAPSYYNFTIDNSPPNITITSPQNDTNINHGDNILFNYTVSDTYSILSNVTDSNGKSFTSIGSMSLNVNYTFNVTDGQQYFTVTAEDALGNKANKTIQYKIVLGVFVIAVNENTLEPMYAVIEMQNESVDYQFPQYLVWDHSEMLGDKIKESEFKLFANDSYDYTKFEIDSLTNQTVADINEIDFTIDNLSFTSGNPTARMDIWMLSSDDFDNPSLSTSISDIKNNGTKVVTDFILDNYLYAGNGTKVQIPLDVPYRVAYGKSYVILFYIHDTSGVKEIDVRYDGDSGAPTNIQRFKSDNTAGTSYAGYFITMKSIGVNELYVPFHTEYLPTGNNVHITVYSGEWVRDYSMVINMSTFANPILYVFIPEPPAENQYYRIQNEGGIGIEGASVVFSRYINNESYTITSATSGADGTLSALLELHKIYKITVIADGYETKSFVESVSGSHSYPSTAEVITLKAVSSSYNNTISVDYPGKGISLSISPEVLLYPYNSGSEYLFCDATSENNNLANLTMIVLRKNLSSLETETIFNQSTSSNNQVLSLSYYLNKTESAGSTIMVTCNLTTIENETYYAKRNYYIPFKNQEVFDTNKVNVGHMTVYIFFLLISLYISYLASMLDIRFGLLVFILMIVITTTFVSTYLYFSVLLIVVAFIYVWLMSRS